MFAQTSIQMKKALKFVGGALGLMVLVTVALLLVHVDFSSPEKLDDFIEAKMEAVEAKGLAIAFIENGQISWSNNYGHADVEAGIRVTDETVFQIASVSKTVTGVAIMQLYERGLIDLDVSINRYLPFGIVNPNFP